MAPKKIIRNPYIVGGFVRGPQFYGRQALVDAVFDGSDRTIWLMGNRRSGKTSLLRKLEDQGNDGQRVTFHISLEAADTIKELQEYLIIELERNQDRLDRLELTSGELKGKAPHEIIRLLDQRARSKSMMVILLLDEAEALIGVAEREGDAFLKDLRREMERSYSLRVVLAATRRLTALNDICNNWVTSNFLDGVILHYLGALEDEAALALIQQAQSEEPQPVAPEVGQAILEATGGHAYLTQWLCNQVWTEDGLHAPGEEELTPDTVLSANFQSEYHVLTPIEQKILRCLASGELAGEAEVLKKLDQSIPIVQLRHFMLALTRLCYVRRAAGGYQIGNRLLGNWLQFHDLEQAPSHVSDRAALALAEDQEQQHLVQLIAAHRGRLNELEIQAARKGVDVEQSVANEIDEIRAMIAVRERELARLQRQR